MLDNCGQNVQHIQGLQDLMLDGEFSACTKKLVGKVFHHIRREEKEKKRGEIRRKRKEKKKKINLMTP